MSAHTIGEDTESGGIQEHYQPPIAAERLGEKVRTTPNGIRMQKSGIEYHLAETPGGYQLIATVLDDSQVIAGGLDEIATLNACQSYEVAFDSHFNVLPYINISNGNNTQKISMDGFYQRSLDDVLMSFLGEEAGTHIIPFNSDEAVVAEDPAAAACAQYRQVLHEVCGGDDKKKSTIAFRSASPEYESDSVSRKYKKLCDLAASMILEPSLILISDDLWNTLLQYQEFAAPFTRSELIIHVLGTPVDQEIKNELMEKLKMLKKIDERPDGPVSIRRIELGSGENAQT